MELLLPALHDIVNSSNANRLFIRNQLKQYLQVIVLQYLFSHPIYRNLIFYGGSALSLCYHLPRLSEDLDFIDHSSNIDVLILQQDLTAFFAKETDVQIRGSVQKFRIYLKFPILRELGLSGKSESDDLFIKLEIYADTSYCKHIEPIIVPMFTFNHSLLVRSLDLPTLMSTKIRAILYRKWEKTNKDGKTIIFVKGRDYFDLMWFLEKKVSPNMDCIEDYSSKRDLYSELISILKNLDATSFQLDLETFIENQEYLKTLSQSIQTILQRQIQESLDKE